MPTNWTPLYLGCAILLPPPAFARAGDGAVMALDTLWQDHASERATPPLFIISHSCLRPRRTANRKEESMSTLPHLEIIGLDVSCDWLDIRCLSDSRQLRLPNMDAGPIRIFRWAKTCSTFARSFDLRPLAFAVRAGIGRPRGFLRWMRLSGPFSFSHFSFPAGRYPASPPPHTSRQVLPRSISPSRSRLPSFAAASVTIWRRMIPCFLSMLM